MQKKILIVEDELPLLKALTDKFAREGFQTLQAQNGQEGLTLARSEHPDLILLDIIMPVMDGMTMLKHLRSDDWGKTVPVIILTNLSPDDKTLWNVVATEPSYYLLKADRKIEELVTKTKEILKMT